MHLVDEAGAKAIADSLEAKWLNEQKLLKIAKLNANINAAYQAYLKKYPDVEIRTFEEKAKESFLVKKNPNTPCEDTPLLCKLTANGTTEERNILAEQYLKRCLKTPPSKNGAWSPKMPSKRLAMKQRWSKSV